MNEKIREIAEQAEDWADNQNFYESDYRDYLMEKFAELIVTETCKMLVENSELRAATLVGRHFPLWK